MRLACLLTVLAEATEKTRNSNVQNKEQKHYCYKEKTLQMHEVNLCSEIPTKRTTKGCENLPYHWTRFPAAKIIDCFNWTVPPDRWKVDSTVYGMIPIKNRSRKQSHNRDGIGVGRIKTFPFSSDSAYDSVVYDLEKTRLSDTVKQKGKYKPITRLVSFVIGLNLPLLLVTPTA